LWKGGGRLKRDILKDVSAGGIYEIAVTHICGLQCMKREEIKNNKRVEMKRGLSREKRKLDRRKAHAKKENLEDERTLRKIIKRQPVCASRPKNTGEGRFIQSESGVRCYPKGLETR